MKKIILTIFVLLLVFCVAFIFFINTNTLQEDVVLAEIIFHHVAHSVLIDFDLMITGFEWDEMFIFGKYADPRWLLEIEGVSWRRLDTPIRRSETIFLLVFVNNKEIVAYVNYPMHKGFFGSLGVFKREFSKFRVEHISRFGRGTDWYSITSMN